MKPKAKNDPPRRIHHAFRDIFSEPASKPSKPSFSRIFTAFWMTSAIAWISVYLGIAHKLPEGPTLLGIGSVAGLLYGANKFANAIGGDSDSR